MRLWGLGVAVVEICARPASGAGCGRGGSIAAAAAEAIDDFIVNMKQKSPPSPLPPPNTADFHSFFSLWCSSAKGSAQGGPSLQQTKSRHTPHVTRYTSHVTRHTSHVTSHTSHVTRHTSHVTPVKLRPYSPVQHPVARIIWNGVRARSAGFRFRFGLEFRGSNRWGDKREARQPAL